jgi:glucose/arabinose dehydrogenase
MARFPCGAFLCWLCLLAACGKGGSGRLAPSPPATFTVTRTAAGTATRTLTPIPTASPTSSPTRTIDSSATPSATATARGEIVVPASEATGLLRTIPSGPAVGGPPRMPAQYRVTNPPEIRVETFVAGLVVPWSLAFAPDGRLFISERPGRIRDVVGGLLTPEPWATPEVTASGEAGLMGLAVHPRFESEPWIYVCYTTTAGALRNRISRIREVDGRGQGEQVLLDSIPAARVHDGCRLKFAPDGTLYATTGDSGDASVAQDFDSLAGKVLRLNPDGSIPSDNPFGPDSYVFSYGHRNPQGLAFDPITGNLLATEHGPSGEFGLGDHDELNLIVGGGNYGWPLAVGAPNLPSLRDPLLLYVPLGAPPAGATFYASDRILPWRSDLFFTSLRGQHLQRVVLAAADRTEVAVIERLFEIENSVGRFGRLRDVVEGPDGSLYVATSNRDGRGTPSPDDDRILRLIPSGTSAAPSTSTRR